MTDMFALGGHVSLARIYAEIDLYRRAHGVAPAAIALTSFEAAVLKDDTAYTLSAAETVFGIPIRIVDHR